MTSNEDKQRKAELSQRMKDACYLDSPENYQVFNQVASQSEPDDGLSVVMPGDWQDIGGMPNQCKEFRWWARLVVEQHLDNRDDGSDGTFLMAFDPRVALPAPHEHYAKTKRCDICRDNASSIRLYHLGFGEFTVVTAICDKFHQVPWRPDYTSDLDPFPMKRHVAQVFRQYDPLT